VYKRHAKELLLVGFDVRVLLGVRPRICCVSRSVLNFFFCLGLIIGGAINVSSSVGGSQIPGAM
jgi:hypothetical protein